MLLKLYCKKNVKQKLW